MTLATSLQTARSALSTYSGLSSIVSRNVSGAQDANYARRDGLVNSQGGAGIHLDGISRTVDKAMHEKMLSATSQATGQQALSSGLTQISQTIGDPDLGNSPAQLITNLGNAMNAFASRPQDYASAQAAVAAGQDLAQGLNEATSMVQQVRQQADSEMATSVGQINSLLSQFEDVNSAISVDAGTDAQRADNMDSRDKILQTLSQEIGIRTTTRSNGDMAIYTDSGVTLFDHFPRTVEMSTTPFIGATDTGNAVYIDGVSVTGDGAMMGISSGRIAGLSELRDGATVDYQNQLDETARSLIEAFSETDQADPPVLPAITGLFSYSGDPAVPASGAIINGLAGDISINANVDGAQGGDPFLLRDGSIGDPGNLAYTANASGASGYTDRLNALYDGLSQQRSFDSAAGIGGQNTISGYASASGGWVEQQRATVTAQAERKQALKNQTETSFSNATGVNLDEEMMRMLSIERSFQASSKLVQSVNAMFDTLFAMVR